MRSFERPDTPAQMYATVAGLFLVALGVFSLIFADVSFDTVGPVSAQPDFLIWSVSGWTTILWIVMGCAGVASAARLDTARGYALFAGLVFAVIAVWGFVDGNDVFELITADTTNNITHAVLGALGLIVAGMPRGTQRPEDTANARRFDREQQTRASRETMGREVR